MLRRGGTFGTNSVLRLSVQDCLHLSALNITDGALCAASSRRHLCWLSGQHRRRQHPHIQPAGYQGLLRLGQPHHPRRCQPGFGWVACPARHKHPGKAGGQGSWAPTHAPPKFQLYAHLPHVSAGAARVAMHCSGPAWQSWQCPLAAVPLQSARAGWRLAACTWPPLAACSPQPPTSTRCWTRCERQVERGSCCQVPAAIAGSSRVPYPGLHGLCGGVDICVCDRPRSPPGIL